MSKFIIELFMISSLLVRAIRQLSPKDRLAFSDFVACPLFNRRPELLLLCRYLTTHADRPGPEKFSAESLFDAAYPGKAYDNSKLRHLMSYTLDAYRQFLALQEWQSDPEDAQRYLVSALRRRGLDKLFDKAVKKADTEAEKRPIRDARHHFRQYHIQQEKLEFKARHERSAKLNLQPLPDELTAFYVSEMLRHGCSALMHQAVAGQTYQMELLDAVISVVEKGSLIQSPAVAVYYHTYRMLQSPEDQDAFEQVKSLLVRHEKQFGQEEMRGLYLMVINGCIRRMNAGHKAFIREAFEVYRLALERGFLTENGILSSFTYKNIIRIGAALGEHAWTEQFIEQQRAALHPRERENTYLYNRAFLYFEKGDYAQAMPLLQQVDLDDPLNSLHARRMLVRSYVELDEFSALESVLQSFGSLLNRQKNLGYHRDLNLNFVRFTQRLLKLPPGDQAARNSFLRDLQKEKQVAEKEWLLEKLR
ncbi:MAG TPA: hypothetical protein VK168_22315 [Saprospiraceae bacterium]|nr:hypothetical protein [Saprospiraceae bacterium]